MIYGVGVDIAKVSRFKKWVLNEEMLERFFALGEIIKNGSELHKCEHYASRFAVKEAFSKALGTGIRDFKLREVFCKNEENGKPVIELSGCAKNLFEKRCGKNAKVQVSLSHEKEYALAFVVIEV